MGLIPATAGFTPSSLSHDRSCGSSVSQVKVVSHLEDMDDGGDRSDIISPDNHLISSQNVIG